MGRAEILKRALRQLARDRMSAIAELQKRRDAGDAEAAAALEELGAPR